MNPKKPSNVEIDCDTEYTRISYNLYATIDGRIFTCHKTPKDYIEYLDQDILLGYRVVRLPGEKQERTLFYVHQLVLCAFSYGDPDEKDYIVVHKNGNKLDNRLANLTYMKRKNYLKRIFEMMPKGKRKRLSSEEIEQIKREYIAYSREHNVEALSKRFNTCVPIISKITKSLNDKIRRQNNGKLPFEGDREHFNSKLSKEDVLFIRRVYKRRDPIYGVKALAEKFGVVRKSIQVIVDRKTWKNI